MRRETEGGSDPGEGPEHEAVEAARRGGVAALLAGRIPVPEGAAVAAVLSGGIVALDRVATMVGGSA